MGKLFLQLSNSYILHFVINQTSNFIFIMTPPKIQDGETMLLLQTVESDDEPKKTGQVVVVKEVALSSAEENFRLLSLSSYNL